jgi:hypothetical protein
MVLLQFIAEKEFHLFSNFLKWYGTSLTEMKRKEKNSMDMLGYQIFMISSYERFQLNIRSSADIPLFNPIEYVFSAI